MNELSALVSLKSKITVYVSATVSVDQGIDDAAYVERVACILSACLSGAMASPVHGCWVSDSGGLVEEVTAMVLTCCSTADAEKYIDDIVSLCHELKREMGQETIALEYNSEMCFI